MTKITESARGQSCQVRIIGVCNANPETVVFAHIKLKGAHGIACKPQDLFGTYACSACHDVIDGRVPRPKSMSFDELRVYALEGMARTHGELLARGLINVTGERNGKSKNTSKRLSLYRICGSG